MHTLNVLIGGFALLGLGLLVGRWAGGTAAMARVALFFVPVWLIVALVNMYIGVSHAGYSMAAETPIFLVIFAIPVAVALTARTRLLRGGGPNR